MSVVYFNFDRSNRPVFDGDVLSSLKGYRLGIITSEPKEEIIAALQSEGVIDRFDPDLIVRRSDDRDATFSEAEQRARVTRDEIFYVDTNSSETGYAADIGFYAVADPSRITMLRAVQPISTDGLPACLEDAKAAALNNVAGPNNETNFDKLLQRLEAAKVRLPPLYLDAAHVPFVSRLSTLGTTGFTQIMVTDPNGGTLLQDIAHSILQNGERFEDTATDAFQEVITDLYDGFLSAQDRKGIKTPDRLVLPPLVKWGNPDFGPYTWPADATKNFDVQCAVVNMPPAHAQAGLMAWAALAHETAGHDILHADKGLEGDLSDAVAARLRPLGSVVANYWAERIDETASDVMGILNMGPAAAIGTIVFFRGLLSSFGQPPRLRNAGGADDPHPVDILRGYLGAATVRRLSFAGAKAWADLIKKETDKDAAPTINLGGFPVPKAKAEQSARIVADVIATHKSEVLRNHALIDIQNWRDADETIVQQIIPALVTSASVPATVNGAGVFAAHVVAAAVVAALSGQVQPSVIFRRMISVLKSMHDGNPSWGPLHVLHPSSIYRNHAYYL